MLRAHQLLVIFGFALGNAAGAAHFNHSNGQATFWIVATSESRRANHSIYMTTSSSRGQGALRTEPFRTDRRHTFHFYPASADTYYLVGAADSRKAGYMAYLNHKPEAWPFDPNTPDPQCEWRLIESSLSADGPSYFIVSTLGSRKPNEMLFIDDWGSVVPWGFDSTDTQCLWSLVPAPPSTDEMPDYEDVMAEYTSNQIGGTMLGLLICLGCSCCGALCRTSEQREVRQAQGQHIAREVSNGRMPRGIPVGRPVGAVTSSSSTSADPAHDAIQSRMDEAREREIRRRAQARIEQAPPTAEVVGATAAGASDIPVVQGVPVPGYVV